MFFGWDAQGAALVDLVLPLAVVVGDLGDLHGQLGLLVIGREAEGFQGALFAFGRDERFGLVAGQVDGAVQARLHPHLGGGVAAGVDEAGGFGGSEDVVGGEDAAALAFDVGGAGEAAGWFGHGFPLAPGVLGLGEDVPDLGGAVAEDGP
jgi:hypothetical protein